LNDNVIPFYVDIQYLQNIQYDYDGQGHIYTLLITNITYMQGPPIPQRCWVLYWHSRENHILNTILEVLYYMIALPLINPD
jgi:hypothetical protein